jgi:hypothetical protein
MPHQVELSLCPKEEPGEGYSVTPCVFPTFEPAETVLHDIKEEGEEENQESVEPLVFEPIPEYWEELDTPGPGPIVSRLVTPTTENNRVISSELTARIQTRRPENTIVPQENQKSAEPLVFEPIPESWEELDTPGPGPIVSQLETLTTDSTRELNSSKETAEAFQISPKESAKVPQNETPPSNTGSAPVSRDTQPEMTVSLPSYISPMTSPIDVLTPINITYSRGVPPPTIVRYEEGEEKKDVIKIDVDDCYSDHKLVSFVIFLPFLGVSIVFKLPFIVSSFHVHDHSSGMRLIARLVLNKIRSITSQKSVTALQK